jgi:hypothetical protein
MPLRVDAQRAEYIRIGLNVDRSSATRPTVPKLSDQFVEDTSASRAERTARGAIIGAVIGAAAGTIAAFIETHKATVTDHSEDGLAYIGLLALGTLVGLVVGAVVGFVRN